MKLWRYLSCYSPNAATSLAVGVMFVLLFTTTGVFATSETPLPIPMVWEQSFGDEQYSYESKAAMVSPGGMLTVVGTYKPVKSRHAPPEGGWIWKIDGGGKRVSDVRFNGSIMGSRIIGIDAFELIGEDVVAVTGHLSDRKSFLLYVGTSGKAIKTIDLGSRRIARLFRMSDGNLVLAGQKEGNMLLMMLDKSGVIIWEKIADRGKDDLLIDGSITADRLLLVEISGKQEQFFMADSMVGLVAPTADGNMGVPAYTTKGRGGSLARNSKRILLVYDAAMTSEQDIRFVLFDNELHVIRESSITKEKIGLERFKVGRAGESGFIAVGAAGGKMILTFIDMSGQIKWQHTRPNNEFFLYPEVVGNDFAYVVSTMMVLTSNKQPKTLVNILKIDPSLPKH